MKQTNKKTIPLYVESIRGDDRADVPKEQLQNKVEEQLKDDKLVTLEKEDKSTEILTKSDIPPTEAEQKENKEWADKFEATKSATATNKSKGF